MSRFEALATTLLFGSAMFGLGLVTARHQDRVFLHDATTSVDAATAYVEQASDALRRNTADLRECVTALKTRRPI